jgi:hypothetical protein
VIADWCAPQATKPTSVLSVASKASHVFKEGSASEDAMASDDASAKMTHSAQATALAKNLNPKPLLAFAKTPPVANAAVIGFVIHKAAKTARLARKTALATQEKAVSAEYAHALAAMETAETTKIAYPVPKTALATPARSATTVAAPPAATEDATKAKIALLAPSIAIALLVKTASMPAAPRHPAEMEPANGTKTARGAPKIAPVRREKSVSLANVSSVVEMESAKHCAAKIAPLVPKIAAARVDWLVSRGSAEETVVTVVANPSVVKIAPLVPKIAAAPKNASVKAVLALMPPPLAMAPAPSSVQPPTSPANSNAPKADAPAKPLPHTPTMHLCCCCFCLPFDSCKESGARLARRILIPNTTSKTQQERY